MFERIMGVVEEGAIAFLLAFMTLLTFVQVVLRYLFNTGFVWALELTTYLFAWMVLLGMSYGVKVGSHLGVDALVRLMPLRWQRIVGVIVVLLGMLYAGLLLFGSYEYVDKMHTISVEAEDLPIQRWVLLLCLPIGYALLMFRLGQAGWRIVTGEQQGLRLADEAKEAIEALHGGPVPEIKPGPGHGGRAGP